MVAGTNQEPKVERKSDYSGLVAPLPGSISQYYQPYIQQQPAVIQPQTLGQILAIQPPQHFAHPLLQQNTQINPFLYLGQGLMVVDPGELHIQEIKVPVPIASPAKKKSLEKNSPSQEKNSYVLYRPSVEDRPAFVDMLPPSETQEPNYYTVKPKKSKKYSEKDAVKSKKVKASEDLKKQIKTEEYDSAEDESREDAVIDTVKENKKDSETESTNDEIEESVPTSRLDFQIHGN
jgi:hypothetical protein